MTCSQIGKGKTSPDIYLACADKLGTAPSETLVFEDAVFAAETHLIDYVLLHELAHTREMNHGKRFWALLDRMTDGRAQALRTELRKYKTEI